MKSGLYIGIMSGTSADGVDAVLIFVREPEPATCETRGAAHVPFPDALRAELLALMQPGDNEIERAGRATVALMHLYAEAVKTLLLSVNVPSAQIVAIGSHGQTVRHRPEHGFTVQLNNPALLAHLTGINIVSDFRSADIAAGGQGAPLVPRFHGAVFAHPSVRRAIVNIGGIANISVLNPNEPAVGWDTGPGNCLLDAWCERYTGQPFDREGAWGAGGQVSEPLLAMFLRHPYFALPPPKSTGREVFHVAWVDACLAELNVSAVDVQATLVVLTARSIAEAAQKAGSAEVYLCGGGVFNRELVRNIALTIPSAQISTTKTLGIHPMQVEGAAFARFAAEILDSNVNKQAHNHLANAMLIQLGGSMTPVVG